MLTSGIQEFVSSFRVVTVEEKDQVLTLFDQPWEKLHLSLPVVFIVAGVAELLLAAHFSSGFRTFSNYIVSILFFNYLHNFLSIAMILVLPEFRNWIQHSFGSWWRFGLRVLLVFGLVAFIYCDPFELIRWRFPFFLLLLFLHLVRVHHGIAQSFGLACLYDYKIFSTRELDGVAQKGMRRASLNERRGFQALLFFNISFWIFLLTERYFSLYVPYSVGLLRDLKLVSTFGVGGAVLYVLFNGFHSLANLKTTKFLYLLRMPLYFLSHFSFLANLGTQAIHGSEFLCVFISIRRNSSATKRVKALLFHLAVGLCLVGCVFVYIYNMSDGGPRNLFEDFTDPNRDRNGLVSWINSWGIGIAYLHYYVDRQMFRMRKPSNRQNILPMLIK